MRRTTWLASGLAFGLSTALAAIVTGESRRRRRERDLQQKLQVWEGEGGQVPGATLGAAAAKPAAENPKGYSAPA